MQPPPDGPVCEGCPAPILVQVTANSRIYVNTVPTDIERVISAVNRLRAEEPYAAVVVEAHDEANHGVIVRLWDEMHTNRVPVALTRTNGVQPVP
jgi:biopolymer transport protein ExbD